MPYLVPKNISAPKPQPLKYWPDNTVMFNGGLNLIDREWKIPDNQTSNVLNLWWQTGELGKRLGQEEVVYFSARPILSAHKTTYNGKIIAHIDDKLIEIDPNEGVIL